MSARYILIIILFFVGWLACKLIWNPRPRQRFESPLTRVVWTFWDQGFENAPIACQMALKSWKYYNPSWTVIPLDRKSVYWFLEKTWLDDLWHKNQIQTQSDLLRINLLDIYGGVWVDATLWCNKPLDDWLYEYLEDFFVFKYDTKCSFGTWFMASKRSNYICKKVAETYNAFWKNRFHSKDYFNFHHTFHKLCRKNKKFRRKFWKIPRPFPAHELMLTPQNRGTHRTVTDEYLKNKISKAGLYPVFKLSTKTDVPNYESIARLLETLYERIS